MVALIASIEMRDAAREAKRRELVRGRMKPKAKGEEEVVRLDGSENFSFVRRTRSGATT